MIDYARDYEICLSVALWFGLVNVVAAQFARQAFDVENLAVVVAEVVDTPGQPNHAHTARISRTMTLQAGTT